MSRRRVANPNPVIIDKHVAANSGKTRYYTGKPCRAGHLSERFVSSGGCVECVHPIIRVCGSREEFWRPDIRLPVAVTGAHRTELERLLDGWTTLKLREWGYAV
jgi:hypothetical protein